MAEALHSEAAAGAPPRSLLFDQNLREHRELFDGLAQLRQPVERAAELLADALRRGGKIMLCGNGGSAADCQHLAAEFTGRFGRERAPLAGLALTTDSSALTCIGNDYGFDAVFARQVGGLGRAGDCLIAISTSGRSPNVLRAVETARALDIRTIALCGGGGDGRGGPLAAACDLAVVVPSPATARVQEAHIFIGHCWCGLVEQRLLP